MICDGVNLGHKSPWDDGIARSWLIAEDHLALLHQSMLPRRRLDLLAHHHPQTLFVQSNLRADMIVSTQHSPAHWPSRPLYKCELLVSVPSTHGGPPIPEARPPP